MHFLHPEFLYYMLPPLFILFGLLLTQNSSQEIFFSQEVMEKLRVSANTLTLKARNALFFVVGLLLIIALSSPVIDEGSVTIQAKSADIMIALDISDSMLAEDLYPNRLLLAKKKALELLRLVPTERVGVIAFAKNSYLVSPLSFDSSAVAFLLRSLDTNSITEQGTNFLAMLEVVKNSIKEKDKKYLLLLSDGGDSSDFSQEIAFAKKNSIVVYVLGIGTTQGAPIKKEDGSFVQQDGTIIVSKLNQKIQELATATGGVYIKSVNANADIKAILQEIEAHSKKKELQSKEIKRYLPLFYYPLGLALAILLIATSSMSRRARVNLPALLIGALLFAYTPVLHAGLLDFVALKEAKQAYAQGEYQKAQKVYGEYAAQTDNSEVNYNIANALYKQGKYKEALNYYQKATFEDADKRAKNFSNLGNAYVKSKTKNGLQKAVQAYEDSLKIEEDKDTRENLEAVKKAMEQQKKQQQNKKNQKRQENKKSDKQHKKNNKSQKSKNAKQDKKNKSDKEKQQKQKKDAPQALQDKNITQKQQQQSAPKPMQMSEAEEKKWLKQLSKKAKTYLYRLNKNSRFQENIDAKPW